MKKIFFALLGCFIAICAHAAQIVNVDYVHKLIAQKWDISVPIRADNPMQVANMKYLLTAIDVANEILNGEKTTDYGNGEFATLQVADTTATNQAVETLIKKEEKIFIINTLTTSNFFFYLGAGGTFFIDWGDGTVETITQDPQPFTGYISKKYSHNYSSTGKYTIKISGKATGYHVGEWTYPHAIGFCDWNDLEFAPIESIEGSLGGIFPCLPNGGCPSFAFSFASQKNLTSIPENLFTGISGAPAFGMFHNTFSGCSGLTSIPAGLFAGISGAPAEVMFQNTFSACSNLTSIPDGLFAGISGAPAEAMFAGTFYGCRKLTSIPENLFGNISGTAQSNMFSQTFYNCTSLTGPSARINGQYLYEIWPSAKAGQVQGMYSGATRLSDYSNIPSAWK